MISLAQRNLFNRIPNLRYQLIGAETNSDIFYFLHVCKINSILSTMIKIPGNHLNFLELCHFLAFEKNAEFFLNPPIFVN